MSIKNVVLGAVVLGTVVAGGVAVDTASAPEAKAAACWGQITLTQGKNYTGCGRAQHFNRFKNGTYAWGNIVGSNAWSRQKLCYANVAQYGMVRA
ncbi:hypothetical protein GCM10017714_20960 [Curtobacterium pusillum]|uniref:Lactococcin 972 family bacteriocin n=1 Tax=Curtobacterium pusillum TaxID=69373 RepID=A0ABX2M9T2_9MICO|nr:hypothetical protein [Curtobacterium pusillum]NUU14611.1 hypothetical protein [Curtobacterium pusillum]GLK31955.1 hypothetical protein GCM10017610_22400 [Curtobacterium pusillum]